TRVAVPSVEDMNTPPVPQPPTGSPGTRRPPIVWQAVLGLGALVLLWPLTSLTGLADVTGAPARALPAVGRGRAARGGVGGAVPGRRALAPLGPLPSPPGLAAALGAPARALLVVALVGAAWVGVVGLGRLPRPVLTLTLTGMAGGGYLLLADLLVGTGAS